MDQLEVFREQLRRKPGETQKKEMKKKKEGSDATVRPPPSETRESWHYGWMKGEKGEAFLSSLPMPWNTTSTTSIQKPVKGFGLAKNKQNESLYRQNLYLPFRIS